MVKSPEFLDNIDNKNIVIASLLQENRKQLLPLISLQNKSGRHCLPLDYFVCYIYYITHTDTLVKHFAKELQLCGIFLVQDSPLRRKKIPYAGRVIKKSLACETLAPSAVDSAT